MKNTWVIFLLLMLPLLTSLCMCYRRLDKYQEACLDFVQLQRIDYSSAFYCTCQGGVTAGGVTLGFHMAQMRLVSLI